jgi:hypothetical protein
MPATRYQALAQRLRCHAAQLAECRRQLRDAQQRAREFGVRLPRDKYEALLTAIRAQETRLVEAQAEACEAFEWVQRMSAGEGGRSA